MCIRKLILTTFSSLFILTGCNHLESNSGNSKNVYPPSKIRVGKWKMPDGKGTLCSIDMAYENYDNKQKYPWCLMMVIELDPNKIFPDGLPIAEEVKTTHYQEQEILAELQKLSTVHYVGHIYSDSFMNIFTYIDDPAKIHEYMQKRLTRKDLPRHMDYGIKMDPRWNSVKNFFAN